MCECKGCCDCCEEDFEEEEISHEEIVDIYLQMIDKGECLKCTLNDLYEYAFDAGQLELAKMYKNISQDIIEEIEE